MSSQKRSLSPIPAYQQIEEDIRGKVLDGRLPAGSMLASRHNLAKEYGVALSTVQQAISNLIAAGVLEASDRRGTFVSRMAATPVMVPQPEPLEMYPQAVVHDAPRTPITLGIFSTARIAGDDIPDVGSLWARLAIRSLERTVSAAGGATCFFDRYPERLGPYPRGFDEPNAIPIADAIAALRQQGADALAVIGVCDSRDLSVEVLDCIDVDRVPTVYMSWHEIRPPMAQVFYDNRDAGYQAAQHLLRRGYRNLLFLAPFEDDWVQTRVAGARDAVRDARLPAETLQISPATPTGGIYTPTPAPEQVYHAALDAFERFGMFKNGAAQWAIIAPNDFSAYSIVRAAAKCGKAQGPDFGLIGFDDDAQSCTVGLSTVRPPIEAMGEEAGRLLLRACQGENSGLRVCLRSQVIPRASTLRRSAAETGS